MCNSNDSIVSMNSDASSPEELQNNVEFVLGSNYDDKSEEEDSGDKSSKEDGSGKEY